MRHILAVIILFTFASCGSSKKEDAAAADCYTTDVKPIVDAKCASCHTNDHKTKWYESKEKFLASAAKTYVAATSGTVMPPAGSTALTAAEKQKFADCK